ncbi:MAG: hypothetical protein WAW67_00555 [Candidatus Omnitrophota bacterium]
MNCLSIDSLVMTKDGLKRILDIEVGDEVAAFEQNTHNLVYKKCSGVFDNGIKDVYKLRTHYHSIKATSNHPFLILKKNSRGMTNSFIWKTLEEIKPEDEVVTLKRVNARRSREFAFEMAEKGDYKVNKINPIEIPTDNEFFDAEKVIEIKYVGKEPTLDLRVEGEHNFIADGMVVHNTGVQRSGLTPFDTNTSTSPIGAQSQGNWRPKKPMPEIAVAHGIPYCATASAGFPQDIQKKVKKALSIKGPKYLQIHVPCPLGWRHGPEMMFQVAKLAVETGLYPLIEYEAGKLSAVRQIQPKPVEEYLKTQGRFKHLLNNPEEIKKIQEIADSNIEKYNLTQKMQ